MTQKKWEVLRDSFAVEAIKMLAKIDTINLEIDSLKKVKEYAENINCEQELYKLVGATEEDVKEYRKKFDFTEMNINNKTGTPADTRRNYFDFISSSKISCLPEFYDRLISMKNNIGIWESAKEVITVKNDGGLYEVMKDDCLKNIAEEKYGDPNLWTLIWEANKDGVVNADKFRKIFMKKITNPNIIYPGQILKIPPKP